MLRLALLALLVVRLPTVFAALAVRVFVTVLRTTLDFPVAFVAALAVLAVVAFAADLALVAFVAVLALVAFVAGFVEVLALVVVLVAFDFDAVAPLLADFVVVVALAVCRAGVERFVEALPRVVVFAFARCVRVDFSRFAISAPSCSRQ